MLGIGNYYTRRYLVNRTRQDTALWPLHSKYRTILTSCCSVWSMNWQWETEWVSKWASVPASHTVSLEKCLASKGKQNYKLTASETQTHNQWNHQLKRNHRISPKLLTPGKNISLNTTDPCLPSTSWHCSDIYQFISSQHVDWIKRGNIILL